MMEMYGQGGKKRTLNNTKQHITLTIILLVSCYFSGHLRAVRCENIYIDYKE